MIEARTTSLGGGTEVPDTARPFDSTLRSCTNASVSDAAATGIPAPQLLCTGGFNSPPVVVAPRKGPPAAATAEVPPRGGFPALLQQQQQDRPYPSTSPPNSSTGSCTAEVGSTDSADPCRTLSSTDNSPYAVLGCDRPPPSAAAVESAPTLPQRPTTEKRKIITVLKRPSSRSKGVLLPGSAEHATCTATTTDTAPVATDGSCPSTRDGVKAFPSKPLHHMRTLEEREMEYHKVRRRIFGSQSDGEGAQPSDTNTSEVTGAACITPDIPAADIAAKTPASSSSPPSEQHLTTGRAQSMVPLKSQPRAIRSTAPNGRIGYQQSAPLHPSSTLPEQHPYLLMNYYPHTAASRSTAVNGPLPSYHQASTVGGGPRPLHGGASVATASTSGSIRGESAAAASMALSPQPPMYAGTTPNQLQPLINDFALDRAFSYFHPQLARRPSATTCLPHTSVSRSYSYTAGTGNGNMQNATMVNSSASAYAASRSIGVPPPPDMPTATLPPVGKSAAAGEATCNNHNIAAQQHTAHAAATDCSQQQQHSLDSRHGWRPHWPYYHQQQLPSSSSSGGGGEVRHRVDSATAAAEGPPIVPGPSPLHHPYRQQQQPAPTMYSCTAAAGRTMQQEYPPESVDESNQQQQQQSLDDNEVGGEGGTPSLHTGGCHGMQQHAISEDVVSTYPSYDGGAQMATCADPGLIRAPNSGGTPESFAPLEPGKEGLGAAAGPLLRTPYVPLMCRPNNIHRPPGYSGHGECLPPLLQNPPMNGSVGYQQRYGGYADSMYEARHYHDCSSLPSRSYSMTVATCRPDQTAGSIQHQQQPQQWSNYDSAPQASHLSSSPLSSPTSASPSNRSSAIQPPSYSNYSLGGPDPHNITYDCHFGPSMAQGSQYHYNSRPTWRGGHEYYGEWRLPQQHPPNINGHIESDHHSTMCPPRLQQPMPYCSSNTVASRPDAQLPRHRYHPHWMPMGSREPFPAAFSSSAAQRPTEGPLTEIMCPPGDEPGGAPYTIQFGPDQDPSTTDGGLPAGVHHYTEGNTTAAAVPLDRYPGCQQSLPWPVEPREPSPLENIFPCESDYERSARDLYFVSQNDDGSGRRSAVWPLLPHFPGTVSPPAILQNSATSLPQGSEISVKFGRSDFYEPDRVSLVPDEPSTRGSLDSAGISVVGSPTVCDGEVRPYAARLTQPKRRSDELPPMSQERIPCEREGTHTPLPMCPTISTPLSLPQVASSGKPVSWSGLVKEKLVEGTFRASGSTLQPPKVNEAPPPALTSKNQNQNPPSGKGKTAGSAKATQGSSAPDTALSDSTIVPEGGGARPKPSKNGLPQHNASAKRQNGSRGGRGQRSPHVGGSCSGQKSSRPDRRSKDDNPKAKELQQSHSSGKATHRPKRGAQPSAKVA